MSLKRVYKHSGEPCRSSASGHAPMQAPSRVRPGPPITLFANIFHCLDDAQEFHALSGRRLDAARRMGTV